MPAASVAQSSGQRGQILDVRVEDDQEVVPQSVMLRQFEICHALSNTGSAVGHRIVVDVDPAYARVAAEPPLLSHRELAGAGDDRLDRRVECASLRRGSRTTPCSRAPAERFARSGCCASDSTSATSPASIIRCTRSAIRLVSTGRGQRRPNCWNATRRVRVDAGTERAERPSAAERDLEGPHNATRIGRLHLRRRDRVESAELRDAAPRTPSRRGASLELGTHVGPASGNLHRVGHAAQVQAGAGHQHGTIVRGPRSRAGLVRRSREVGRR